jgi:hypothetical protein
MESRGALRSRRVKLEKFTGKFSEAIDIGVQRLRLIPLVCKAYLISSKKKRFEFFLKIEIAVYS